MSMMEVNVLMERLAEFLSDSYCNGYSGLANGGVNHVLETMKLIADYAAVKFNVYWEES